MSHSLSLGDALRQCRRARGVTLDGLSCTTGLSKGFLSQLENGRREASLATLETVAQALSIPVAVLVVLAAGPADAPPLDAARLTRLQKRLESLIG